MKRLIFFFILSMTVNISVNAQKIYAIVMANTVDNGIGGKGGIGKSCLVDYDNFVREITIIGEYLEYEVDVRPFIGQECTKENLLATLTGVNPTDKDIVLFYYSGHGTHAPNDNDLLPQIMFKYRTISDQAHFLALRTVKEKLQSKGARLNILMADCCNNIVPGVIPRALQRESGATLVTDKFAVNYKKLFLGYTGTIIMTGCEKGQTSGGYDDEGGIYSSAFWDELASLGRGDIEPTWKALTQRVKEKTSLDTRNEQIPYSDLSALNTTSIASQPVGTMPVNVVSADDSSLGYVLKQLIDTSKSDGQRLAMVNNILNNYFTSDAKVITVGRNNVNIGGESIGDYLRRISINKRITGLVILSSSKGANGKTSFIRVHEIRKQ